LVAAFDSERIHGDVEEGETRRYGMRQKAGAGFVPSGVSGYGGLGVGFRAKTAG
jgi:hypothetical protein